MATVKRSRGWRSREVTETTSFLKEFTGSIKEDALAMVNRLLGEPEHSNVSLHCPICGHGWEVEEAKEYRVTGCPKCYSQRT